MNHKASKRKNKVKTAHDIYIAKTAYDLVIFLNIF